MKSVGGEANGNSKLKEPTRIEYLNIYIYIYIYIYNFQFKEYKKMKEFPINQFGLLALLSVL